MPVRFVLPVAAVALVASGVAVVTSAPSGAPAPIAEAPSKIDAVFAARTQGTRVEAVSERTETRSVFAEPDGTLTAEIAAVPKRVRQGDRLVDVDPALVPTDGALRPKATGTDIAFSTGGSSPLVRFAKGAASFELTWPTPLPAPHVEGATATYADALPGVDLVMSAQPEGYTQHLVVRSRDAAAGVIRVPLGLRTTGVTFQDRGTAGLQAVDAAGAVLFHAPQSLMWDSAPRPESDNPMAGRAPVRVELGHDTLALLPDQATLTSPRTVYPVTIDPNIGTPGKNGWTTVYDDGTQTMRDGTHWNGANSQAENASWVPSPSARVGRAYNTSPKLVTRSAFRFDTSFVGAAAVHAVQLRSTVAYGPGCGYTTQVHDLYRANTEIGPGTNWSNLGTGTKVGESQVPSEYSNCPGHKPVGFTAGGVNPTGNSTYWIQARDENDQNAWRKYVPDDTYLEVKYNNRPTAPTSPHTNPPLQPCALCAGMPYVGGTGAELKATISDPDGQQVRPMWDIYYDQTLTNVDPQDWQNPGTVATTWVDFAGHNGQKIAWYVQAQDPDGATGGFTSGSPTEFVIDTEAPAKAPTVESALYPADNAWHGGVGVPGRVTLKPNGVPDVAGYLYGWSDPPSTRVDPAALGGEAAVDITPTRDGPVDLYVQSVDRAGNRSPVAVHHFYVRAGNGAVAQYAFEGNAKDSAFLGERHGVVTGPATYEQGAVGSALHSPPTGTTYVTAPNAVRTDAAYSVSAWVRLDKSPGGTRAIVSQNGVNMPGFALWYRGDSADPATGGRWSFGGGKSDSSQASGTWVTSDVRAQTNTWTHVAGVADLANRQVRLYVNGTLAGTAAWDHTPWQATGDLEVGRARWAGAWADPWVGGSIDEVQVFDRALTDQEIKTSVIRDNVRLAHWKFDEESGTRSADHAGANPVTLSSGATFGPGATEGGGGLRLDGVSGSAQTSGPVVRTDSTYSVAAWVKIDQVPPAGKWAAVAGQRGTVSSGFVLGAIDSRWGFVVPKADDGNSGDWAGSAVSTANSVQANTWTHLAAVQDRAAGRVRLYVNGREAASGPLPSAWHADGAMSIGRAWLNGAWADAFPGTVDEVRVYSRVVGEDELRSIVSGDQVRVAAWNLDGDVSDTKHQYDGTVSGGADWTVGQSNTPSGSDLALRLNGTDGHASVPHVVDTSRSFSVAVWAKLDKLGGFPSVVSQDGSVVSSFQLQVETGGHWAMTAFAEDVTNGGSAHYRAVGPPAQVGVWTHLVGVYDADSKQMSLYVNGVRSASVTRSQVWNAPSGLLRIGRGQWNGNAVDYFPGAIDDVAVYSRALFTDEIRVLAGRDTSLAHHITFDEPSGKLAGDSAGARPATLASGATRVAGRLGNAVQTDGSGAFAATTGIDVRTDESFTVAAWVYLPSDVSCSDTCVRTAVSVDGDQVSKFRLGHTASPDLPFGRWTFELPEPDGTITRAAVSTESGDLGTWVHLTGVYNAQTGKTWIFVNGDRQGDGKLNTRWQASGGLIVGRGKEAGAAAALWRGTVDDVRLYAGELDKSRARALYESYPPDIADSGPAVLPAADAGHWRFDERTGTTVGDSSGKGKNATAEGGVGWTDGPNAGAGWLDGTSGFARTDGKVLSTDRAFSIGGWAYPTAADQTKRALVGQDGNRASAFAIVYDGAARRWTVQAVGTDKDNPTDLVSLAATAPAVLNEWTHVMATHDPATGQLRLYVNGELSAVRTGVRIFASTGSLTIGRMKSNGVATGFFARGIDDVRAFNRSLSAGEVAAVHADVPPNALSLWRMDGDSNDSYWRVNHLRPATTGVSYVPGLSAKAVRFDGRSGSAATEHPGVSTRDSFTVSAWARLDATDRTQTILGQDGDRASGFVLQYRHEARRWAFGVNTSDSDSTGSVHALAEGAPVPGAWTHLVGVYDRSAQQLRLYVNGELAGTAQASALWSADGGLTVGRGKAKGGASDLVAGDVDEVRAWQYVVDGEQIRRLAAHPAPIAGQLGRFVNAAGQRYTAETGKPVRPGYWFETPLGIPVSTGPNTTLLISCETGGDFFTSPDNACEGRTRLGELTTVYSSKPTNLPTVAVYRCQGEHGHFDSLSTDCEGGKLDGPLGYTLAYAALPRYTSAMTPWDLHEALRSPEPGYSTDGVLGYVSLVDQAGSVELTTCRDRADTFTSTDATCEGARPLGSSGRVWAQAPPEGGAVLLRRCSIGGNRFLSAQAGCEGQVFDKNVGYVLSAVPTTPPQWPSSTAAQSAQGESRPAVPASGTSGQPS